MKKPCNTKNIIYGLRTDYLFNYKKSSVHDIGLHDTYYVTAHFHYVGRPKTLSPFLCDYIQAWVPKTNVSCLGVSLAGLRHKSLFFGECMVFLDFMANKNGTVEPSYSLKVTPEFSSVESTFVDRGVYKSWIIPSKHRHSNINTRYKGVQGNLVYAGNFRSFSSASRSEETVMTNSNVNNEFLPIAYIPKRL